MVGGIEITAALTGLPMFGTLGTIAGMTGVIPNVEELKDKYKKLKAEECEINNTGVGFYSRIKAYHKFKVYLNSLVLRF